MMYGNVNVSFGKLIVGPEICFRLLLRSFTSIFYFLPPGLLKPVVVEVLNSAFAFAVDSLEVTRLEKKGGFRVLVEVGRSIERDQLLDGVVR